MDFGHADRGPCLELYNQLSKSEVMQSMTIYQVCLQKEQKLKPQAEQLRNLSHPDDAFGSDGGFGTGA